MKSATIQEIKTELKSLPSSQLTELCLRLAKFKKDNKELLTYLLFEAADEAAYIKGIKKAIDEEFAGLPKPNLYLTKKSLRKVLRVTAKQIRYTGSPQAEVERLYRWTDSENARPLPLRGRLMSDVWIELAAAGEKEDDAGVEVAGASAHRDAAGGRESHGGIDGAPAGDGA